MQHVYYIDTNFVKENSSQYILSIRYETDGLSFCIHNSNEQLLVFFFQPFNLENEDALIAKVKKIMTEDSLLNLKYKKVYIIPCNKEKIFIPAHSFNKESLADMYCLSMQPNKNDTLLYRKIKVMGSYIVEALPRNFINFLSTRYQPICIVNSVYPFIIQSLSNPLLNTYQLFIDIHDLYFDLIITDNNNQVLIINSFDYGSVTDIIYHALNCLKQSGVNTENLQTTISGNLVNDPILENTLNKYIPNISIVNDITLSQLIKNNKLNSSSFIHLQNIHRCE